MAAPSADDIAGAYQTYLGRAANPDEITNWMNGTYGGDPNQYISQIQNSGEAQAYSAKQGSPFMSGGSPSIPPTAIPTPPATISPSTFNNDSQPAPAPYTPPPLPGQTSGSGSGVEALVRPYAPAQGGLQLVGFDPSSHMGQTPTATEPKYAVANIVQEMSNQPGFDPLNYAPQAAATLNAMFGTTEFKATDGQTIMYGDEYVHTAPAGYGGGDPNGGEELFWGYTGSGGSGGGSGSPAPSGTGTGATGTPTPSGLFNGIDIGSLIQNLLNPPSSSASLPTGFAPAGGPLQPDLNQFGQDPFSQLITSGLSGLIAGGGATPQSNSVRDALASIINGTGALPGADQTPSLIAARDAESQANTGMLSDLRSNLANRGLVGEPGQPQGAEVGGIERTAEQLAPTFANAVAQIEQHGLDLTNSNAQSALSLATGMSQADAANMLTALSQGTSRQTALAGIALQTLDQNRQWQQFLATYGLDRDQVANTVAQGNMSDVIQLLQLFLTSVTTSTGGFI